MKPHKHSEVIKAWADGASIEFRVITEREWRPVGSPTSMPQWYEDYEYRVKPKEKPLLRNYSIHVAVQTYDVNIAFRIRNVVDKAIDVHMKNGGFTDAVVFVDNEPYVACIADPKVNHETI